MNVKEIGFRHPLRASVALAVLWLGTGILLRGSTDLGGMIAILACASGGVLAVVPGRARPAIHLIGQLVLWAAILAATALVMWGSSRSPGVLLLFAGAATWFTVGEPILLAHRAGRP
jgi:hypothetical protein